MPLIRVEKISKTFQVSRRNSGLSGALRGLFKRETREVKALECISFSVEPGECVGYIGPNGAGKSTTVKILSGILVPDSGSCRVDGFVPWKERARYVAGIGVVFGQRTQLWWDLPVIDSFDLLKDIYRVPTDQYRESRDELIAMLNLSSLLDVPVRQLSLGQRMRCDLAASLLHRPRLLFLDEPTIGLDAISKLAVREFVRRLNREDGVTVILTTHDMDDVEALCSRVMVINDGQILSDGTLEGLRARFARERRLILELSGEDGEVHDPKAALIRREGGRLHLRFDPEEVGVAELVARLSARYEIKDLWVENPPIEEVIARAYGEARK